MRSLTVALIGLCICLAQCKDEANEVVETSRGIAPVVNRRYCGQGYVWVPMFRKCFKSEGEGRGIVPGDYKALCKPGYIRVEWRKKCMRASRGAEQNREVAATRRAPMKESKIPAKLGKCPPTILRC